MATQYTKADYIAAWREFYPNDPCPWTDREPQCECVNRHPEGRCQTMLGPTYPATIHRLMVGKLAVTLCNRCYLSGHMPWAG